MKIKITAFPFLFWFMKTEKDAKVENNKIIKGEREHDIKKLKIYWYLLAKYSIILLLIFIVFTKYDFILSVAKIIEYIVGISIAFSIMMFYRHAVSTTYIILFLIGLAILFCLFLFFNLNLSAVSYLAFTFKYMFTFLIIFTFMTETNKEVYSIYNDNNKVVAHIVIED